MTYWLEIFCGIGAIQSILFILLILAKKNKRLSDWNLILWFLIFFTHLVLAIVKEKYPINALEILTMTIGFLHGPFFYYYAKTIFNQHPSKFDILHFLPFLVFTISGFYIKPNQELSLEIIVLIAKLASRIIYPLYVLFSLNAKLKFLKSKRADHSILELSWLKNIAILFLISSGIAMLRLTTELLVGVAYFELLDMLLYVSLFTIIGFFGLKYGIVYTPEISLSAFPEEKKYKHSPLKNDEINIFQNKINSFFKESTMYLHSDFSLTTLSKSLNIPKHHLSQIINSDMGTTFYDLINTKRIEYAMHRIRKGNNKQLTFEGLGYECGFNSKSTFFYHFKKHTGKTPGQFVKGISSD
ncbi:helix-turn-helix domain-containing protein [Aquimarina algiphila]|uniref:helix-turn-helix domain-containing protein n=1 Tax=Aquimarina algiphila TaxID=2047982 RepID=UPI00232D8F6C|nr:helix-turn-helix domain-containing protein [Aquimarina algiphila]